MSKSQWIWMPHAAHFIGSSSCQFHLATYVNGYVVSTIGDYYNRAGKRDTVATGYHYETMVFRAIPMDPTTDQCCPYEADNECLARGLYNTGEDARLGHMALCEKYDQIVDDAAPVATTDGERG